MRDRLDLPHHDGSALYVSDSAPGLGSSFTVRVRVPRGAGVSRVLVRTTPDAEPEHADLERTSEDEVESWWQAEVVAHNPVTNYRFLLLGSDTRVRWLTAAGVVGHEVADDTDFRVLAAPAPPSWVPDAVLYQVFPDRFARSGRVDVWPDWALRAEWADEVETRFPDSMHQLYGGDLHGVAEHLDHVESLGATGMYLNPIFPAMENHRYCATSFDEVDPVLGGDEALVELSEAAHRRGMRLVGDLTANHSGSDHPWFRAAQGDRESVDAGRYHWIDHPDSYVAWSGVGTLPKFDHRSPDLRRRLYEGPDSVVARWLRPPFSLDGWRVDAANMAGRYADVDLTHEMARAIRDTMRAERDDAYLLAEHNHDATQDLIHAGWDGTMNYMGFARPIWQWLVREDRTVPLMGVPIDVPRLDGPEVVASIDTFCGRMPWRARVASLNLLGSHDTTRWRHVAGSRERALVGAAMLFTFPGVPSVFMGDEIGLDGHDDLTSREPFPWDDEARWDTETLEAYRALIRLRRAHPALRTGGFRWVVVEDDVLVYLREDGAERLLVQVARDDHEAVALAADALGAAHLQALTGGADVGADGGRFVLPSHGPRHGVWLLA